MDGFDKILKTHGWRFPKGYPDMNDPKDKKKLFEIVNQILEVTDAEEGLGILKQKLDLPDEKYLRKNSKEYRVLVPRNQRSEFINKSASWTC